MAIHPLSGPVRYALPQFLWGSGLANTLEIGFPFAQAVTYPEVTAYRSVMDRRSGGERDVSSDGAQFCIDLVVRGIPGTSRAAGSYGVAVAGWDTALGWRDFLLWAMVRRHQFTFIPDRAVPAAFWTVWLKKPGPQDEQPTADDFRFTRQLALTLVNAAGLPFTGY